MSERAFAHVCETGGARLTWLHGIEKVRKRYLIAAAAHNLGLLMCVEFKMGTPRGLQEFVDLASSLYIGAMTFWRLVCPRPFTFGAGDLTSDHSTGCR